MTRLATGRTLGWTLGMLLIAAAAAQDQLPELHSPLTMEAPSDVVEASAYPLLPEGAYLADRLIRVVPLGSRATAAVFVRGANDTAVRPMALLPCANTQAIEQLAKSAESSVVFEVSGQVFVSRGLNYFLPLIVRVVASDQPTGTAMEHVEAQAPDDNAPEPPALSEARGEDEISVEALINELEAATVAAAAANDDQGDRPLSLQREGGVVTLRRGRVDRGVGGAPVFTFDVGIDADNPEVDPPMGLLPCSLTDEMDRIASRRGDHVTLTVSGRVFLYDESNYLLPTMFFVNRSGEGGLSSAQ